MKENLKLEIFKAMKARDEVRIATLKMLSSELHNEEIKLQKDLSENEEAAVVKREVKKRKDAIDAYKSAGNTLKAELEEQELKILLEYLPEQLDEEQVIILVEKAISETKAVGIQDMGKVMGLAIKLAEGKADGSLISRIVKEKLS